MRITLALPSGTSVELSGAVKEHIGVGGLDGRGPGIDIALDMVPQRVLWLIESALKASGHAAPSPQASAAPSSQASAAPSSQASASPSSQASASPSPMAESHAIDDGDEWVTAEGELVRSMWHELESMGKLNPFQVLGVGYECSDEQVRSAFGSLSKKYHPDRFAHYESFEIRELANEHFLLLRDAYRKLATPSDRARCAASLRSGAPQPARVPRVGSRDLPLRAQDSDPPDGLDSPTARTPIEAYEPPRQTPHPATPQPKNRVAMGLKLMESGDYERALGILRIEARKYPDDLKAQAAVELGEGLRALANNDRLEAGQHFETVLELDPSNERAARAIAEMRRHATDQRRGLLSKLIKKG